MKNKLGLIIILLIIIMMTLSTATIVSASEVAGSENIEIQAVSAILTDYSGSTVFYEQDADTRVPIASMVKIMTLNVIFDEIGEGRLDIGEDITASENASSMGGSQAFLDANNVYKADELIKSIIVASANDSCVAMAERISFSVDNFVVRMNETAAEFGLLNTNFVNCTGLPETGQYSTARDVAVMFGKLIENEQFFGYAGEWMYDFQHPSGRTTSLTNTNKLIRFYEGCDGGKTGFTNEAKSCLAATAIKNGTRYISVVVGAENSKSRNSSVCKLFDYGFAGWKSTKVIDSSVNLDSAIEITNSNEKFITVAPAEDYFSYINVGSTPEFTHEIVINYDKLPIISGDLVGEVVVSDGDSVLATVPLVATSPATEMGYTDIIFDLIAKW